MKSTLTRHFLAIFALASLATGIRAQSPQSRAALGKIDFQALLEAAPAVPATTAEAARRAYGSDLKAQNINELEVAYTPFQRRATAARAVIKDAVGNRERDGQAIQQRTVAQANSSPIISRMGGIEKMGQMSEDELKQAAAQAAGNYQQSMSGAPPGAGGGMQAMMQKLMSDPAYQARFEKMTKAQQEAELQKYMGNAQAPPPPTRPTAAERQAERATTETAGVVASQRELGAIIQRISEIDMEFAKKDQAVLAAPSGHKEIGNDFAAKLARVPLLRGEATVPDPAKVQPLERERVTRDRARAAADLQQQAVLYNQRKARYKDVATAYATWLRQNSGGVSTSTAQLLDDASVQVAVRCEERLIEAAEALAKYSSDAVSNAAAYEAGYQMKMSEPLIK